MTTFKKNYIGKGTQVDNLDIVRVTLKMEELEKYTHEYNGEKYISFEVAKLLQPDQYGKTHTVYVSEKVESPKSAPKTRKRKTATAEK